MKCQRFQKTLAIFAGTIAATMLAGIAPAHAQSRAEMMLKNADADGDGRISRSEWKGPPQRFDYFDADGDGYVTLEEIQAGLRGGGEARQRPVARDTAPEAAARPKSCDYQPVTSPESAWTIDSYAPDCAYAGTTLFADNTGSTPRIVEVDMQGKLVWQYKLGNEFGSFQKQLQIMDVDRQPNGNTLFVLRGWGLVEVNRDGKTVWKFRDEDASHDADRLPNGNTIYVRAWVAKGKDVMREVTPDGKIVRSWNGMQDYNRPPFANIEHEGWIHTNAVQAMPNGDVYLSLRNFSLLVRLTPDNRVVEEIPMPLSRTSVDAYDFSNKDDQVAPHDPEYHADGSVAVCLTNKVTCIAFDGKTRKRLWSHRFGEEGQGPRDVNLLPNGNYLVVTHKLIEELTPQEQSVWRLTMPAIKLVRGKALPEDLFKAQRIGADGSIHGN